MTKILTAFMFSSLAGMAMAQAPATPATTATPVPLPQIERHTCKEPRYPGRAGSGREMDKFQKDIDAYTVCINAYGDRYKKLAETALDEQKKLVEELNAVNKQQAELKNKVQISIEAQRSYVEARNIAVNEYNQVVTELRKAAGADGK